MNKNPLIIINNEKISKINNNFYCDNINLKILPEGLSKYHDIFCILRSSNKQGNHKINQKNISVASNIFKFIYSIVKTLKISEAKYLLISITPYTFLSFLILFLFRKKIFVYLISSGHEEYKFILGAWSVWIYHIMYSIITAFTKVIVLDNRLSRKKKCHVITNSTLDDEWLKNQKNALLDKIRFLYVGRVNPEKGIYEFLQIFEKIKLESEFSIAGNVKNLKFSNSNVKILGYISEQQSLIDVYDKHNITVLPSFTEGQPYVVDESLARKRPVIIFDDIEYIVKGRRGIFVSKRNINSFLATTKYIMQNYEQIQKNIEKNKFSSKDDMIKQISDIICL